MKLLDRRTILTVLVIIAFTLQTIGISNDNLSQNIQTAIRLFSWGVYLVVLIFIFRDKPAKKF